MRASRDPNLVVPQSQANPPVARTHSHIPPQARPGQNGTIEVLSNAPVQDVAADPGILRSMDGRIVRDATASSPEPSEDVKLPTKYLVMQDYSGMVNGQPGTRITRGKVIDDANYDVRKLKHAGVKLKEIKPGEDPLTYLEA